MRSTAADIIVPLSTFYILPYFCSMWRGISSDRGPTLVFVVVVVFVLMAEVNQSRPAAIGSFWPTVLTGFLGRRY